VCRRFEHPAQSLGVTEQLDAIIPFSDCFDGEFHFTELSNVGKATYRVACPGIAEDGGAPCANGTIGSRGLSTEERMADDLA